jgi:hypothetical protein
MNLPEYIGKSPKAIVDSLQNYTYKDHTGRECFLIEWDIPEGQVEIQYENGLSEYLSYLVFFRNFKISKEIEKSKLEKIISDHREREIASSIK